MKFRKQDQVKLMHRLDTTLMELLKDPAANATAIASREEQLLPIYTQARPRARPLHARVSCMLTHPACLQCKYT